VGVNTFILTQSGGAEGLGFAIPCGVVNVAYQQLRKFGHLHRPEIGISVQTITPTLAEGLGLSRKFGVIISDVEPDGPAEAAGLRVGDVLLAIDGRAAGSVPYVAFHLLSLEPGDKVHLDVLRQNLRLQFDVPLKAAPKDMDQISALADPEKSLIPTLGILGVEIDQKIAAMAPDLRDPFGILVAAKAAGTAGEVPLTTGDVIRTLNGQPMTTLDRLRAALQALKPGAAVVLQIQRDQKLMYVAFTLD
jgi:serine protease Do